MHADFADLIGNFFDMQVSLSERLRRQQDERKHQCELLESIEADETVYGQQIVCTG